MDLNLAIINVMGLINVRDFRPPMEGLKASTAAGSKFLLGRGKTPHWGVPYKSLVPLLLHSSIQAHNI